MKTAKSARTSHRGAMRLRTAITRLARLAGLVWLMGLWMPFSHAAMVFIRNDVSYTLGFTDTGQFSDAQIHLQHSITQDADAGGDNRIFNFNLASPSLNVAVTGDADTTISGVSVVPASLSFTITSVDGEPGRFAIDLDRVVNVGTTLTTGSSGGFHYLEHRNNPSTTLQPGSPFTFVVMIPGDWSTAGSAQGNHQLLNVNPLWTIDQDFVYDGVHTIFSGHIDNYINDGTRNAGIVYRLIGAAVVPLPPVWALIAAGVAGLAFARRR